MNPFRQFLIKSCHFDAAHDLAHTERVVKNAERLVKEEGPGADSEIIKAAAWLHDCVTVPKDHSDRSKASMLAAEKAGKFLESIQFPQKKIDDVKHAIEAHSFSAGIKPQTIEAKIVQDADRLDALGAMGIARCFAVGGQLNRPIYNPADPFCKTEPPNDQKWTLDHFYVKLFELPGEMNTEAAKREAEKRVEYMKQFLQELEAEITTGS